MWSNDPSPSPVKNLEFVQSESKIDAKNDTDVDNDKKIDTTAKSTDATSKTIETEKVCTAEDAKEDVRADDASSAVVAVSTNVAAEASPPNVTSGG